MPNVRANGIDIEYDEFGNPSDPALLLIMGFTAQMTAWDEEFCRQLAGRGFRVIRFDNRDCGLTTKIESGPQPDIGAAMSGDPSSISYTLEDMADDAAGLLDTLGIPAAHIVGASMGGFIAQTFAIRHPGKTLSLCSIMSSTGDRNVGQPTPEAMGALMQPPPQSRDEALERGVAVSKVIGSPGFPFDEAKVRERSGRAYDRMFCPEGNARQLVAIMAQQDRTEALGALDVPALVIHGAADPLVQPSGGEATAKAIPGAELLMVEGMAHDLPEGAWPQVLDAIAANAAKAKANGGAR
jgi:pimeloyl-ACP methyl ester carboxylesterase